MSECSARVTLAGLAPDTQHYYRVCLHKPSHGFAGVAGGCFTAGSFCTLPGSGSTNTGTVSAQEVSFVTMAAGSVARRPVEEAAEQWAATVAALSPSCCLMMGDLAAIVTTGSAATTITREERVRRYTVNTVLMYLRARYAKRTGIAVCLRCSAVRYVTILHNAIGTTATIVDVRCSVVRTYRSLLKKYAC
jgi:phosphodiesterase/alkaline phosphatase D-like protein